jgi:hypothetical protein
METRQGLEPETELLLPSIGWESFPPALLAMKDKPFQ